MRRLKRLSISWELIPDILRDWDGTKILRSSPLPLDLRVIDIAVDKEQQIVEFIVESATFDDVPEGADLPWLDVNVTAFQLSEGLQRLIHQEQKPARGAVD